MATDTDTDTEKDPFYDEDDASDLEALGIDDSDADDDKAGAKDDGADPEDDKGEGSDPEHKDDDEKAGDAVDADAAAAAAESSEGDSDLELDELDELASARSDTVPHARFNEVNEQLKATRQELEELRAKQQGAGAPAGSDKGAGTGDDKAGEAEPAFDLAAKEREYHDAIIDGDEERAAELRAEIREFERQETIDAVLRAQDARKAQEQEELSKAEEQRLFDEEVKAVVADYPKFDSTKPDADEEGMTLLIAKRNYLIEHQGVAPHEALRQAADHIAKVQGYTKASAADPGKQESVRTQRRGESAQRNAVAQEQQPPAMGGASAGERGRGDVPNVDDLSEEDWDNLPEAERDKLLGNA